MMNYTVLSEGETIVIDVGGNKHWLDVVETKPEAAISLLGSLDLEVEFAPPKVWGTLAVPRAAPCPCACVCVRTRAGEVRRRRGCAAIHGWRACGLTPQGQTTRSNTRCATGALR